MMDPPGYAAATSIASLVFGGIGYAFIIAMTATSFDRAVITVHHQLGRKFHLMTED